MAEISQPSIHFSSLQSFGSVLNSLSSLPPLLELIYGLEEQKLAIDQSVHGGSRALDKAAH